MALRKNLGQGFCIQSVLLNLLLTTILAGVILPESGGAVRMTGMTGESVDRVKYVVEGDNVILDCSFDLEGEQLYTLLWWKDEQMLLRYLPGEYSNKDEQRTEISGSLLEEEDDDDGRNPPEEEPEVTSHRNKTSPEVESPVKVVTWFDQAGVKAYVLEDPVPRRLLLKEVNLNASGDYVCEVTTEAPTYYTVRSTTTLHVMVPPRSNPKLEGARGVVGEGANVQATCTSSPSLPTPTVTFWINDKRVVEEYMSPPSVTTTDGGEVEVQRSVEFRAHRRIFVRGALLLQCRVTLHDLVWNATSQLLLENYDGTSRGTRQGGFDMLPLFRNLLGPLLLFFAAFGA